MKRFFYILFVVSGLLEVQAQVVFCPPGAKWHYWFGEHPGARAYNEVITYTRNSLLISKKGFICSSSAMRRN